MSYSVSDTVERFPKQPRGWGLSERFSSFSQEYGGNCSGKIITILGKHSEPFVYLSVEGILSSKPSRPNNGSIETAAGLYQKTGGCELGRGCRHENSLNNIL